MHVISMKKVYVILLFQVFEKECTKRLKTTATTFEPANGLFGTKDDKLGLCWTL